MKTVGILGGVGPETTSHVYLSIIDAFKKSGQKTYPSILIYNLPFSFIIENEVIIEGKNSVKMIPYLVKGAKVLEKGGANFGILPCNTLHKHLEDIKRSVKMPFLSILDETVLELKSKQINNVGILATETTSKDQLYDEVLQKNGIKISYPSRKEQNDINKIIVELLGNKKNKSQETKLKNICSSLQKSGVRAVLLACTDLQIITSDIRIAIPIIDTTEILIRATINKLM